MNKVEKDEISELPEKYRPLTMWSIIGWNILFNAFVGISFILTIIFSFNRGNINRRSLARVCLLIQVLLLLLVGVIILVLYLTDNLDYAINYFRELISPYLPH